MWCKKARREQIRLSGTTVSQTPYDQVDLILLFCLKTLTSESCQLGLVRGGFNCSYKYSASRRPGVDPTCRLQAELVIGGVKDSFQIKTSIKVWTKIGKTLPFVQKWVIFTN